MTRSLAILLLLVPALASAEPIRLDDRADAHDLLDRLEAVRDDERSLTIDEVARRDFRPLSDGGLGVWPGQPQPGYWLRFTVDVPATPGPTWSMIIGRPYNPGTLYVETSPGAFEAIPVVLDGRGGSFHAPLDLAPGLHDVILHVPGPIARPSLLHVATPAGQERLLQGVLTRQGLYLGVMLSMLLINLLVGALLRDRAQLWYVGFVATSVATFSLLTGTASRFLIPLVPAASHYRLQNLLLALAVLTGVQFSRLFLDTPRRSPRIDRWMRGFLVGNAAVALATLLLPDVLATRLVATLGFLIPPIAISAGIASYRAGSPWARFYLAGWSLFTVGGFLYASPFRFPAVDGLAMFQLSSVLETVMFTMALADRLRVLRGERVQAERALERSEQRLQSIFDNTIDATWLLDGAGHVVEINDTAKSLPGARERGVELRHRAPSAPPARFETSLDQRWYDVSVRAVDPSLTLVEARDITELKQAELVAARAEKLAALGQLVAGVAHEVNNPNNFLTFNLPIVQEYLDALRPHVDGSARLYGMTVDEFFADAGTLVGHMKHGAERIAGIVAQLKSYVRAGDETLLEAADVNAVVSAAATLVRTQVHQVELALGDDLPRVRMNPGRIEQVVMNLLLNAGQATASTPDAKVRVSTRLVDGQVHIVVEDNGPGVPEALRASIFEPFFTTKSGEQGTGMGLAISQRIVDEHRGTLELVPSAKGACFVVRLPVEPS